MKLWKPWKPQLNGEFLSLVSFQVLRELKNSYQIPHSSTCKDLKQPSSIPIYFFLYWRQQSFSLSGFTLKGPSRWTFTHKLHVSKWKFHRLKSDSKLESHVTSPRAHRAERSLAHWQLLSPCAYCTQQSLTIYVKSMYCLLPCWVWLMKLIRSRIISLLFFLKKKSMDSDTRVQFMSKKKSINIERVLVKFRSAVLNFKSYLRRE